jgi:hypothetical protein
MDAEAGDPYGLLQAMTDAAGRYAFDDLAPGRYVVWPSRGAHDVDFAVLASIVPDEDWEVASPRIDVAPGGTTRLDLVQPDAAGVQGRVLAGGLPQPGALVALTYADVPWTNRLRPPVVAAAETDDLGRFAFHDLVPHRYVLVALAPESPVPAVQVVSPCAGERLPVDVHLGGEELLVAVVEQGQGLPVVDAVLRLQLLHVDDGHAGDELWARLFDTVVSPLYADTGRMPFRGRSDGEGRCRLRHVPPGAYIVRVDAPAYVEPEPRSVTVGGDVVAAPLAFELVRGAVIEGTLSRELLSRHPGVSVRLFREDGWFLGSADLEDGRFLFQGLGAGTYAVRVFGQNLTTALDEELVRVGAGQRHAVALRVDG